MFKDELEYPEELTNALLSFNKSYLKSVVMRIKVLQKKKKLDNNELKNDLLKYNKDLYPILDKLLDDKFKNVGWKRSENGFPILENCLAWFDCIKWNYYSGGDHQILVGEVTSFNSLELEPLTFWNGQIS